MGRRLPRVYRPLGATCYIALLKDPRKSRGIARRVTNTDDPEKALKIAKKLQWRVNKFTKRPRTEIGKKLAVEILPTAQNSKPWGWNKNWSRS
jgi:hypothetical protein